MAAEKKLTKYRLLRKEGNSDAQARFLAGLPAELDDEEFLWTEVALLSSLAAPPGARFSWRGLGSLPPPPWWLPGPGHALRRGVLLGRRQLCGGCAAQGERLARRPRL